MSVSHNGKLQMKKLKYSENLRRMIMLINPHNFSCSYKQSFDEHCTRSLIDCEEEFDVFSSSYEIQQQIFDNDESFFSPEIKPQNITARGAKNRAVHKPASDTDIEQCEQCNKPKAVVKSCEESLCGSTNFPFLNKIIRARAENQAARAEKKGKDSGASCLIANYGASSLMCSGCKADSIANLTNESKPGFCHKLEDQPSRNSEKQTEIIAPINTYRPLSSDVTVGLNHNDVPHVDKPLQKPPLFSLAEFYNRIANRPFYPVESSGFGNWKVCKKTHIPDLDHSLLKRPSTPPKSAVSYTAARQRYIKTQHQSQPNPAIAPHPTIRHSTSDRIPFGLSPFCRSPVLGCSENAGLSSSRAHSEQQRGESKWAIRSAKRKATQREMNKGISVSHENEVLNRENMASSSCCAHKEMQGRARLAVKTIDAPIAYGFQHHNNHHGHMQHYRNDYTKKKLEHVLLQVAQRYQAARETLVPLPKAAVECTDVREGACIQPGPAPSAPDPVRHNFKMSEYKFEVCQNLRTHTVVPKSPIVASNTALCGNNKSRPNSSFLSSPCKTPLDYNTGTTSHSQLALVGQPTFKTCIEKDKDEGKVAVEDEGESRCNSAASSETAKNGRKEFVKRKLLGHSGSSTSVSRSRPTIPSNNRGIVYATSVETPLYIINKPYLQGRIGKCVMNETISHFTKKCDNTKVLSQIIKNDDTQTPKKCDGHNAQRSKEAK